MTERAATEAEMAAYVAEELMTTPGWEHSRSVAEAFVEKFRDSPNIFLPDVVDRVFDIAVELRRSDMIDAFLANASPQVRETFPAEWAKVYGKGIKE